MADFALQARIVRCHRVKNAAGERLWLQIARTYWRKVWGAHCRRSRVERRRRAQFQPGIADKAQSFDVAVKVKDPSADTDKARLENGI